MNVTWKRDSIISDETICKVEKQFGIILPEDVKNVFKEHNNGRPSVSTFDTEKTKEHVLNKLLSFNQDDIENVFKSKHVLDKFDKTLFPLANDPFGNLICLKNGKIYYWLHETNDLLFVANSFAEFLDSLY